MDFAAERARIREMEEYGVKTTRAWNRYHEAWEAAHPRMAIVRRVGGVRRSGLVWAYSIAFWTVVLGAPVYYLLKGH